ncbi:MAG: aspartate aminotransferase family protein [Prevotellaceae bacterium]|jgi:acetylornithine/succinyldiaminopimelate/putrescine aminotransferase|nr:aspartate aminotransferase family protein [Prevotellaceae bacterium]
MNLRHLFLTYQAQTSPSPVGIEIERAEGIYMYGADGKRYTDLIAGVSVSAVGHCHPKVVEAVREQTSKYMHLMVYGEFIQSPQARYAARLASLLPVELSNIYFVNSGSEANEGAVKLAKRFTGRSETVACNRAYHGSTQGAMSLMNDRRFQNAFRPLLPEVRFIDFNNFEQLPIITEQTACVLVEPVQGEAGVILPAKGYLQALRERCSQTGTLLIFDEIQTGFGRLGKLFAMERYGVVPDILTLAKSLGGGMPLGAFIASKAIMNVLQSPALGHITTFGGHPVSCAAGLAALEVILSDNLMKSVESKSRLFRKLLSDAEIEEIRGDGLLLAVELGKPERLAKFIELAYQNGIATDWFLFNDTSFRISPPLIITSQQIEETCQTLKSIIKSS